MVLFFQLFVRERLLRSQSGIRGRSFSFHIGNMEADVIDEDECNDTIEDVFKDNLQYNTSLLY